MMRKLMMIWHQASKLLIFSLLLLILLGIFSVLGQIDVLGAIFFSTASIVLMIMSLRE